LDLGFVVKRRGQARCQRCDRLRSLEGHHHHRLEVKVPFAVRTAALVPEVDERLSRDSRSVSDLGLPQSRRRREPQERSQPLEFVVGIAEELLAARADRFDLLKYRVSRCDLDRVRRFDELRRELRDVGAHSKASFMDDIRYHVHR
jgi:hypothetical protein